jgi:hypothetical protein
LLAVTYNVPGSGGGGEDETLTASLLHDAIRIMARKLIIKTRQGKLYFIKKFEKINK